MNNKILGKKWWTPPGGDGKYIGIIAFESYEPDGQWKCYIGYGQVMDPDEEISVKRILQQGAPFASKDAACALFPQLNAEKFRG